MWIKFAGPNGQTACQILSLQSKHILAKGIQSTIISISMVLKMLLAIVISMVFKILLAIVISMVFKMLLQLSSAWSLKCYLQLSSAWPLDSYGNNL